MLEMWRQTRQRAWLAPNGLLLPRILLLGLAALIGLTVLGCSTAPGHSPVDADTDVSRLFFPGFSIAEPTGPGWAQVSTGTEQTSKHGLLRLDRSIEYTKKTSSLSHFVRAFVMRHDSGLSGVISGVYQQRYLEVIVKGMTHEYFADYDERSFETSFETPFGADCMRIDSVFEKVLKHYGVMIGSLHGYFCIHPELNTVFGAAYTEVLAEGVGPSYMLKAEGEAFLRSIKIDVGGT